MKKGLVLGSIILASMLAQADYYVKWVVDEAKSTLPEGFSYASLLNGWRDLLDYSEVFTSYNMQTGESTGFSSLWERGDGFQVADVGAAKIGYSGYDIFAVAYDEDGQVLAVSDNVITGADIDLYRMNDATGGIPDFSKGTMTFTFSIPEPSSALLVLFGLGALALRRKA